MSAKSSNFSLISAGQTNRPVIEVAARVADSVAVISAGLDVSVYSLSGGCHLHGARHDLTRLGHQGDQVDTKVVELLLGWMMIPVRSKCVVYEFLYANAFWFFLNHNLIQFQELIIIFQEKKTQV